MQLVSSPARQARTNYRHELCHLTYVVLDAGNGGIIRDLSSSGARIQAVAALHPQQRVRLRFELKSPRVRVETHGEVAWAGASGQCGIRFLDMTEPAAQQIDAWIFSDLLEAAARHASGPNSMFGIKQEFEAGNETRMDRTPISGESAAAINAAAVSDPGAETWLSSPLSGQALARSVDGLLAFAGWLLFTLIFLAMVHNLPRWPLTLAILACAAICAAGAYWGLFALFGEATLGARLLRAASVQGKEQDDEITQFP